MKLLHRSQVLFSLMSFEIILASLVLLYLLFLSWKDLKTQTVENSYIFSLGAIGIVYRLFYHPYWSLWGGILLLAIVAYLLWLFNAIGGADAKLLPFLVPFMPFSGLAQTFVGLWFMSIVILVLGGLYALACKFLLKDKKRVPFIPIITLTFLIFWIYRF